MEILYNSSWFKSGYYVYVLSIRHIEKGVFYYIGQTGDRKHIAARSPFYRLWGHFNPYNTKKGTDLQLVNGLIKNNLIEVPHENKNARVCVEEGIENKTIEIKAMFYNIYDFDNNNHKEKRKFTEDVELALINIYRNAGLFLFNDINKIGDNKEVTNKEAVAAAEEIFNKKK